MATTRMIFTRSLLATKQTLSSLLSRSSSSVASLSTPPPSSLSSSILRPLVAVNFHCLSPATAARGYSTRGTSSSLNDQNPSSLKESYSPGCDFNHWLIVLEDPEVEPSSNDDMINMFIKTLARVVGSEEGARRSIYSISKIPRYAFGALVSEDISISLRGLPTVRWVIPDMYVDVENRKYGGVPFMPHVRREYVKNVAGDRAVTNSNNDFGNFGFSSATYGNGNAQGTQQETFGSNRKATSSKPTFKCIPKKGMLFFDAALCDGILKKILEFNSALLSKPEQKGLSLTELEVSRLGAIINILKDSSHYHSSIFSDIDIALLLKLVKSWPIAMIFPVIDLLRMIILHPDGATRLLKHVDKSDVLMEMINNVTSSPPLPANLLTSIRAVTNLFVNSCYYPLLQKHRSEILDAFSSCCSSPNKNVQVSYAALILNYSVLLIESKDQEGQSQVLSAALEIAEAENLEVDSKFLALIAIGSLMLEGLVKGIALDFDVENVAKTAKASKDTRIAEVGADIELLVKQN